MNFKVIKITVRFFSVGYFALLLYVVFFARRRQEGVDFRENMNWIPFYGKGQFMQTLAELESQKQFAFISDIVGNFLMFIPFAFALHWITAKMYADRLVVFLVFFSSLSFETIQYVLNIGVADVDDIVLNVVGGITGVLVYHFLNFKPIRD